MSHHPSSPSVVLFAAGLMLAPPVSALAQESSEHDDHSGLAI